MEPNKTTGDRVYIGPEVSIQFPEIVVVWLDAHITNNSGNPELWNLVEERATEISGSMDVESIRLVEGISQGKKAYRHLGKDPNRYRLSAESLMRRVLKGKGLFSISSAVDALNLVSLRTGITIGGFDYNQIKGRISLGIGVSNEEFEAIGRGPLNVENLPLYRDESGAIGSPTSDCIRTQITLSTNRVLMLITGFYGKNGVEEAILQLNELLVKFCNCTFSETGFIRKLEP
jgi:DNA/RNA-binding domain of Phe-tRNA-synthetase-like protein